MDLWIQWEHNMEDRILQVMSMLNWHKSWMTWIFFNSGRDHHIPLVKYCLPKEQRIQLFVLQAGMCKPCTQGYLMTFRKIDGSCQTAVIDQESDWTLMWQLYRKQSISKGRTHYFLLAGERRWWMQGTQELDSLSGRTTSIWLNL